MKAFLVFLVLGVFFLSKRRAQRIPNFAGPYRALIRRCSNETDEFNSTGKMWAKIRNTHPKMHDVQYGWGFSANYIDFDDSLSAEVRISKWSNNQWKRNAFVMKFPHACTAAYTHAKSLMPFYFGEDAGKCPVRMGSRVIKNQSADLRFPSVPVFPYGRWLFTVAVMNELETVGVLAVDFDAVPRL